MKQHPFIISYSFFYDIHCFNNVRFILLVHQLSCVENPMVLALTSALVYGYGSNCPSPSATFALLADL